MKTKINKSSQHDCFKGKQMKKKRIIFFLIAILAFKKAREESFERGSIKQACEFYAPYSVDKVGNLSSYVSYVKCFYGLNNSSFKTTPIFIDLIELTEDSSRDELIEIISKINQMNDDENYLEYVRKVSK
jgi:hypothetical protein